MTIEEAARVILSKHGRVSADAVRELHDETGMGMCECKDVLTALRTSVIELENTKLRELVKSLYRFSFDEYPDSAKLNFADKLCELGIEVDE